jgi:hypothetical protein
MGDLVNLHESKGARIRSPLLVLLFTVCTLGIYLWFWWYIVNREMRDLGRERRTKELGEEPALSVLAYTLGGLIVVPVLVTTVRTVRRIQKAQQLTGEKHLNGWLFAAFWLVTLSLGAPVLMQIELNRAWRRVAFQQQQDLAGGTAPEGSRPAAPEPDAG